MIRSATLTICAAFLFGLLPGRLAAQSDVPSASPRIALVIGIGAYPGTPVPTAANDAGLVAQTLAAAGFDVSAGRDLDGAALRQAVRDFLDKAASGGPRGIAAVYLAGRAVQVDGENYFAPADARVDRVARLSIDALRIADLTRSLAATTLGAKLVIVDGAYADPQWKDPAAIGLALVDAVPGMLLAFNAAPGTASRVEAGPYGMYARVLAQTMKQGGVPVEEVFDRVRVGVNTETGGASVPWSVSKLLQSFTFFDRASNAPALGSAQVPFTSLRSRPLKDFSPEQAYDVAVARDTVTAYQDYVLAFPDNPLTRRVRLMLAVRRETQFWRAALRANVAPAYWTYLKRYPRGPHGSEARRRLGRLAAAEEPTGDFVPATFDVPPPPSAEILLLERRTRFDDADLPLPPPPPLFLLAPQRSEDLALPPPPPPPGPRFLPLPIAVAIPFVRPILVPGAIAPPRGVRGGYRQPRPFAAGPANGGLVPHFVPGQSDAENGPATPDLGGGPPAAPLVKSQSLQDRPAPATGSRPAQPAPLAAIPVVPVSPALMPATPPGPKTRRQNPVPAPEGIQDMPAASTPASASPVAGTAPAGAVTQIPKAPARHPKPQKPAPDDGEPVLPRPRPPKTPDVPQPASPKPPVPPRPVTAPGVDQPQHEALPRPRLSPAEPKVQPPEPRPAPAHPAPPARGNAVVPRPTGQPHHERPECGHPGQPSCAP